MKNKKFLKRPTEFTENQEKFLNIADGAINAVVNDMCHFDNIYLNDFIINNKQSLILFEMAKMTQFITNCNIYINCNIINYIKLKIKMRKSRVKFKKANKEELRKIIRQIKVKPKTNVTDMVIDNTYLYGFILKYKLPVEFFADVYNIYYNPKISIKNYTKLLEKIENEYSGC